MILLLHTVTAIGLCSLYLGFLVFGSMVVFKSNHLLFTGSSKLWLKVFSSDSLIFLFFIRYFITSAFITSIHASFPFYCLFTIIVNSSSLISGLCIILYYPVFLLSISSFCIRSFSPGVSFVPFQNSKSIRVFFW